MQTLADLLPFQGLLTRELSLHRSVVSCTLVYVIFSGRIRWPARYRLLWSFCELSRIHSVPLSCSGYFGRMFTRFSKLIPSPRDTQLIWLCVGINSVRWSAVIKFPYWEICMKPKKCRHLPWRLPGEAKRDSTHGIVPTAFFRIFARSFVYPRVTTIFSFIRVDSGALGTCWSVKTQEIINRLATFPYSLKQLFSFLSCLATGKRFQI